MPIQPARSNWFRKTVASIQESLITGNTSQLNKNLEQELPPHLNPREIKGLFKTLSRSTKRPPRKFRASVKKSAPRVNQILMENLLETDMEVSEILDGIRNAPFEDPVEVLKRCAREDARETLSKMDQFGLSPEEILEIVKDAAGYDGWGVSEVIDKLKIEKEEDRFEIAKRAARENGPETLVRLEKYRLSDPFEVMKAAAKHDGKGVAKIMHQFPELTPDLRLELAKRCAAQNGRGTIKYIDNFDLEDVHEVYQIAKDENADL